MARDYHILCGNDFTANLYIMLRITVQRHKRQFGTVKRITYLATRQLASLTSFMRRFLLIKCRN